MRLENSTRATKIYPDTTTRLCSIFCEDRIIQIVEMLIAVSPFVKYAMQQSLLGQKKCLFC